MRIEVDIRDDIYQFVNSDQYTSRKDLQKKFGVSEQEARLYVRLIRKSKLLTGKIEAEKNHIIREYKEDGAKIEVNSFTVHTLEQALEVAEIDLDKWKVERCVVNSWQVTMKLRDSDDYDRVEIKTNYQVKVWLKPKIAQPLEIALQRIVEILPKFKFKRTPRFTAPSGIALEMALLDAHFGKLAWAKETGRRDYDLKTASIDYISANEQNLAYAEPFKPEKIFFIVGQDLMHVENYAGITPKAGNILDYDSRLPKIFETALETVIKCIYRCRDIAPVEVIWIPGNHDLHASMFLCSGLKKIFENDQYVSVDANPEQRKARLWGNLLVGWTHELPVNRTTAWVNELAVQFPKLWGKSKFREWHHGHKHKKSEIKTHPVMTMGGVLLRQLTALSPIDYWHYENMFTDAVPGGEAFLWSKNHGVIANFTAWSDTKNILHS